MTELATYQPTTTLHEQMDFARAVVLRPEGAAQSLLPASYRDNPANVLLAVGLGAGMGLSPAESLYRIDVIQGKPCASAELIAANVRKAGHKLRVVSDEKAQSVTATIIRADDPDYPFTVTRDMEWARGMGLATKDNYKKQPMTMLQWRAISGVARLACPEALYGVQYTPDEMYDMPRSEGGTGGGLAAAMGTTTAEQIPNEPDEAPEIPDGVLTKRTRGQLFALFAQKGIAEDEQLAGANHILGTAYESRSQFTEADAQRLIEHLKTRPDVDVPMDGGES